MAFKRIYCENIQETDLDVAKYTNESYFNDIQMKTQ